MLQQVLSLLLRGLRNRLRNFNNKIMDIISIPYHHGKRLTIPGQIIKVEALNNSCKIYFDTGKVHCACQSAAMVSVEFAGAVICKSPQKSPGKKSFY